MRFNKAMALALSVFAVTVQAHSLQGPVKCPGLDEIHRAADKLDFAECAKDGCVVSSNKVAFYDNHYQPWFVSTMNPVTATSEAEAISSAQARMSNASVLLSKFIIDVEFMQYCAYFAPSTNDEEPYMPSLFAIPIPEEGMQLLTHISN